MIMALAPWIFTGPALLFALVFLYAPVVFSVGLSLSDWNFIRPQAQFVGLDNYARIFRDPNFRDALSNTGLYCLVLIPAQILVPLGLAAALMRVRNVRLASGYKIALFLPTILAYSTAGIAWLWLFDPLNGFLNTVLGWFGLPPERWHTDPDLALWCVTLVAFWKNFGLNMLLFLAALVSIPKPVLEAAALDAFLSEHITRNPMSDDYPQMMVRTAVCPMGTMHKEIIFQSQKWAEAFQSFWEIHKMQASAA